MADDKVLERAAILDIASNAETEEQQEEQQEAEEDDFDLEAELDAALATELDAELATVHAEPDNEEELDAVGVSGSEHMVNEDDVPDDNREVDPQQDWSPDHEAAGAEGYEDDVDLDEGDLPADEQQEHNQHNYPEQEADQDEHEHPTAYEQDQRQREIFTHMTEEQLNRYESYRRASFAKPKMKKVMQRILGSNVHPYLLIAMSGICKLFVGELVEKARLIASEQGHMGALLPSHVHQAYQSIERTGKLPRRHPPGRLFRR